MVEISNTLSLKLGLIGGGISSSIGEVHFIASHLDKRFEIVSGCFSKNSKINFITGKKWNIDKKRIYSNWEDLINHEKNIVDAFVVLLPTPDHFLIIKKLISKNLSIICEKPLVSNFNEALFLKRKVNRSRNFIAVTYNYTGYPMVREIKEIIKRKKIGNILNLIFEMPQEVFLRKNTKKMKVQNWRLQDQFIPSISLDLGIHLYNLTCFLTGKEPIKVIAEYSKLVQKNNIIDDVKIWLEFTSGMKGSFWISKSSLGNRNGLKLQIYGDKGSILWKQTEPEEIKISYNDGSQNIIDRSSKNFISNQKRYNRYRAGHPAGFIEAFANTYADIADALIAHKKKLKKENKYVFGFNHSFNGLRFLEIASKSNLKKSWLKID